MRTAVLHLLWSLVKKQRNTQPFDLGQEEAEGFFSALDRAVLLKAEMSVHGTQDQHLLLCEI